MDRNMMQRVAFAAVAIPLALLVVWYGGLPLAVLVAVIAALGAGELYGLAAAGGVRPLRRTGIALAVAVPLALHGVLSLDPAMSPLPYLAAMAVLVVLGVALRRRAPDQQPLASAAITLFGVVYASALPAFLLLIRHAQWPGRTWGGAVLVFFPLVVVWVCDTAAMFAGRTIGGPKLAPTISPGKTRVGAIAGLVGGVLVAPVFALWLFPAAGVSLSTVNAVAIALVLAVVGQLGDLVESLFKREAGVKDSSTLIPGHGGVLDRFDALYAVVPVAAFCYHLTGLV
jgi:phosphatidate cytidylyltransferase